MGYCLRRICAVKLRRRHTASPTFGMLPTPPLTPVMPRAARVWQHVLRIALGALASSGRRFTFFQRSALQLYDLSPALGIREGRVEVLIDAAARHIEHPEVTRAVVGALWGAGGCTW